MKSIYLSWLLIFLAAFFDSYASFVVKKEFNTIGPIDFSSLRSFFNYIVNFIKSPWLLSALVAFISAPFLWFIALDKINLTVGYPVLVGFHLVFVLVLGFFFLNEEVTKFKILGCIFLIISLILISKK